MMGFRPFRLGSGSSPLHSGSKPSCEQSSSASLAFGAHVRRLRRATYVAVSDAQALEGFRLLCYTEGIIPALEPAHAIYYASKLAADLPRNQLVVINLSGRGDKDLDIAHQAMRNEA